MDWSAQQYSRFERERNRPIADLLAMCPANGIGRAADLGCGPGNSTELLRQRYPDAELFGIDNSPDMIAAARQRLPDVCFELADVGGWDPGKRLDLILANASLQWVPDHETLLPALVNRLSPGRCLAVQIPDNWQEPSHRIMRDVAADGLWRDALRGAEDRHAYRLAPEWYHRILRPLSADVELWRTTYFHELDGPDAIVAWFKGSALRPLLARLDDKAQDAFLTRYTDAISRAYPMQPDGTVLLPFPRLFFVARDLNRPTLGILAAQMLGH